MLLEQLKTQTQQGIQDFQNQIDLLLEQQRQLQDHLQKLGSVESAMESAVSQVQTAVALVRNVCPDELENFRAVINAQFDSPPVAELPEATEPEDSEAIAVEPEPIEPNGDGEAEYLEDGTMWDYPAEPKEVADDFVQDDSSEVAELRPRSVGAAAIDFDEMTMNELKQECRDRGISPEKVRQHGVLSRKLSWRKTLEANQ